MTNGKVAFCAGLVAGVVLTAGIGAGLRDAGLQHASASADVAPARADGEAADQAAGQRAGQAGARKNSSRVVLENARVRVKEAIFYPEDKAPGAHTHDLAHVGVVIEGGPMEFKAPGGSVEKMNLTSGGAGFRDAHVTHEPINVGTKPVKVIEVELK